MSSYSGKVLSDPLIDLGGTGFDHADVHRMFGSTAAAQTMPHGWTGGPQIKLLRPPPRSS